MEKDATLVGLRLFGRAAEALDADGQELVAAVADARRAYHQALNYFQWVAEPELVDHAVLQLAAAERRYAYLLGQTRRAGIHLPGLEPPEPR